MCMAQAARCRLWQGARARAVGMGGRHGTGRRLAGRVRWRGWRDVEGGRGALRVEWERAEQHRGCVDARTEDMLMQTSGAVALTLLTVLYWCVCVFVCWACGDDHDDGNVIWRRATRSRTAVLLAAGRRAGWGGAGSKWMAQAARCRLWQGARARAVGMGGRHGTGRRVAGRVRWRGRRDVEGGGGLCGGSGSGRSSSVVV